MNTDKHRYAKATDRTSVVVHLCLSVFICGSLSTVVSDAAEPSLRDKLPRVPPTEPAEAEKTFQTLDGFAMQLIAAEPLTTDPVAAAYDENGRLYVVEMSDYPYTDKSTDVPFKERTTDLPIGKVRLLEDTDGDGRFDKSTVFAKDLSWPTGVALYDGGAFVAGTPEVWYFKDTTGDGVADVRRKVFTGFRKFNVQAVINNLVWGLDHRIYGAGASNGGAIRAGDKADAPATTIARNDFSFDPRTEALEVLSGGARFGNCFDDWGNRFICSLRNPAQHVVLPARYLARNPYLPVATALHDVVEAGDQVPVFRASPPEPWRVINADRLAKAGDAKTPRSESAAVGFFTSASGVTIYRGSAYPEKYRGNIFVGEVAGNLVHREVMTPQGVTFTAKRADANTEFVRSTDNWFRPVNFVNAPDGTLTVLDMYRETIEHPWSIPDDLKAHLDLESGRDRGRIYRLAPPGFTPPKPPRLGSMTTAELVATLEHPNAWHRETAHRLLFERQDKAAVDPLKDLLRDSDVPLARMHALWSIEGLNALVENILVVGMHDNSPGVRQQAVLLAEPRVNDWRQLVVVLRELVNDKDVRVRFQVALTLGEVRNSMASDWLMLIARRDMGDPWMRTAVLSSSTTCAFELLYMQHRLAELTSPEGLAFIRQLAAIVGNHGDSREIELILDISSILEEPPTSESAHHRRQSIVLGLAEGLRRTRKNLASVVGDTESRGGQLVKKLLTEAGGTARDAKRPVTDRLQAVELLGLGKFEDARPALVALLDARQPSELQLAAVRALSGFTQPEVAGLLLAPWKSYSPALRGEVVEALLARADRIPALLDAVEQKIVPASQVPAARKTLLLSHKDATLKARAAALLGHDAASPRKEIIAEYQPALELAADKSRGEKVFTRECAACHKLEGKGHDVGPNLSTVRHRSPEELLTHILDPNREVGPNFVQYLVVIDDGRVATGIIAEETATSLTLRRAENQQETILRQNIEELTSTGASLMPEGVEKKVTPQEMADLLAYVLGK